MSVTWWRSGITLHNTILTPQIGLWLELLGQFPGIGTPCPHLAPGLRRTLWREYLIYYRLSEGRVEIVRALHGRRNATPDQFP